MKTYKIFKNPTGQYEAVKQGWSWPGFFFAAIWACVKKMWLLGIGTIVILMILGAILGLTYGDTPEADRILNAVGVGISVIFGMQGNKLRADNLKKRGYQEAPEIIQAANPEAAVAQYISEYES